MLRVIAGAHQRCQKAVADAIANVRSCRLDGDRRRQRRKHRDRRGPRNPLRQKQIAMRRADDLAADLLHLVVEHVNLDRLSFERLLLMQAPQQKADRELVRA